MRSVSLLVLTALALLSACDGEVDCEVESTHAMCVLDCERDPGDARCAPSCEESPDSPGCEVDCEEDPGQPRCEPSCADDPAQPRCEPDCAEDPGYPRCLPPAYALTEEVDILRDSLGVPHVYAATDADAMYASGYAQAVDRLFQMDLARRQALGRLSEVFGERRFVDDRLMTILDLGGWAERTLLRTREESPEVYELLLAWAAGVDARVQEVRAGEAPLPYGFGPEELDYLPERWRIVDGAAVAKLLLFGSSVQLENDILATIIRDFLPDVMENVPLLMPLEQTFCVPEGERPSPASGSSPITPHVARPARALPPDAAERLAEMSRFFTRWRPSASNNWAIDGRHTANGRSLIGGDPHQPVRSPNVFWLHHINSADRGGSLDIIGFNFAGTPLVQLGHNDRLVWTATITSPDMMDLWGVRTEEGRVRIGESNRSVRTREVEIAIRDGEPRTVRVESVPGYGVLLPDDIAPIPVVPRGRRLLFNWTGFAPTNDVVSFYRMSTARSTEAFEEAVDTLEVGAFNWIAADRDSITYISSLWIPRRSDDLGPRQPWMVLDGDDMESFWTGEMVPREWLPRSRGAERGWLVTANNDPLGFTADGDITNDMYYFGAFFDPGTRAARAEDEVARLVARGDVTPEDLETLVMDTHSQLADRLLALLEDAWAARETDEALAEYRDRPELEALYDALMTWNRRMDRDEAAAVIFNAFAYLYTERSFGELFSIVLRPVADANSMFMLKFPVLAAEEAFPGGQALFTGGLAPTALAALEQTEAWLEDRFGSSDPAAYTWSDWKVATLRNDFGGRLTQGDVATDGGDGTLNVSAATAFGETGLRDQIRVGGGAVYRLVSTFAEDGTPEGRLNFPPGNSGDPDSPFFSNTLEDWIEGAFQPLRFRRADIDADLAETTTLAP